MQKGIKTKTDSQERKEAEKASQVSEECYHRIVDFSPFGISITSEGKILYINMAGTLIYGAVSPSEIIGKQLLEAIPPKYRSYVQGRLDKVKKGGVAVLKEEQLLRLDGTMVDVELGAIPFIHNGKTANYAVFRDITEQNKNVAYLGNMNSLLMGREVRMVALKEEIVSLKKRLAEKDIA